MRAGLSTIQQTLTPEAATVLNQSIAEAARRNHGQTTPLHVAATLLSAPNGYLRQACIRSHPNSSHPLQCRALELCFSVALERLPTTATAQASSSPVDPPISNALMAALKRAQAHQRRGCPEQQQQPLLAVKVELEQLIISILDDPSVSRVMREASFSSPAVKAAIEQSLITSSSTSAAAAASQSNINPTPLNVKPPPSPLLLPSSRPCPSPSPSSHHHGPKIGFVGGGFRPGGFGSGPPGFSSTPSPMTQAGGMSMYLNPRLQQQQQQRLVNCNSNSVQSSSSSTGQSREEDVKKVIEILSRTRKKNPVLVGESEPEAVVREVLRRIETKELGAENPLINVEVEVVPVEKELGLKERRGDTTAAATATATALKLKELGGLIERKLSAGIVGGRKGLILDLGDMKWLVDQPPTLGVISTTTATTPVVAPQQGVSEAARAAVVEMGKVLARFSDEPGGGAGRLWVIGTATCETYLRCQVYHPTMENEWDLQAVSIAARAPALPGKLTRLGTNGILGGSLEPPNPVKSFPSAAGAHPLSRSERSFPRNLDAASTTRRTSCCPQCMENYNQEISKQEQSVSDAVKSETTRHQLPQWLQKAKISDQSQQGEDEATKQKHQELFKKWSDMCQRLHPGFHQNGSVESSSIRPTIATPVTGLYTNPLLAARQALHPKPSMQLPKILGNDLRLEISPMSTPQPLVATTETSPKSPVRTDLVLGQTKTKEAKTNIVIEKSHQERVKDLLSCISSETQQNIVPIEPLESVNKSVLGSDIDSFKRILKGLTEKVWWQKDAASAVASTVTQCKAGNRRRRAGGARGDTWLLFSGPDRTGKKKLAMALSELVCGVSPIIICLGSRRDCDESEIISFRGKTVLDRIGEAIRRNPHSVIMLQDVDEANMLLRGSIKRAMERGRFADSYGREISLGNIIFILTASSSSSSSEKSLSGDNEQLDEEKLASVASGGWQLRVSVGERRGGKRQPSWLIEEEDERAAKQRRREAASLSFDLNEMADDAEEDRLDGSRNSSDLTVEHGEEKVGGGQQENNSMVVVTISAACRDLLGLVDDAIVFKPVDLGPIKQTVERTVRTRIRTIVGEKARVSIDEAALEKILGGVWLGRTGLDSWVEKVLVPSLSQIKCSWVGMSEESCNSSDKVVRVETEEEESEPRSHGDWLPNKVSVRVGAF